VDLTWDRLGRSTGFRVRCLTGYGTCSHLLKIRARMITRIFWVFVVVVVIVVYFGSTRV
jgi:hypothetical protein